VAGLFSRQNRNTCDDTAPSPVVRNSRGDTAEGQVQVCTWIGTVVNSYITIQINEPTRIWPKKTLIDYDPAGPGHEPGVTLAARLFSFVSPALDQEWLGGWPRGVLENEMKRHEIVLFFVLLFFIALGAVVWATMPLVPFLFMMAMQPAGWGCDEGPVTDQSATNARGDVVEEYIKVCTAVGSFADYSILLQLHGGEKAATLAEHSDSQQDYPKFRWLSDNALMIDLGKVRWIRSPVHKVAGV
jgi:hypothetical protein